FLLYGPRYDASVPLVLWQIGMVGDISYGERGPGRGTAALQERLGKSYPGTHQVCLYEAALFEVGEPMTDVVPLSSLDAASTTPRTTLYVPPYRQPEPRYDLFDALDIPRSRAEEDARLWAHL